jgi:Stress-induced morphogen (activity unknown)
MTTEGRTTRTERVTEALTVRFNPVHLAVIDESHRHEGHSGWREGGETHYRIDIVSDAFEGKSRVERHRLVNDSLAGEFSDGLHALVLNIRAPSETR